MLGAARRELDLASPANIGLLPTAIVNKLHKTSPNMREYRFGGRELVTKSFSTFASGNDLSPFIGWTAHRAVQPPNNDRRAAVRFQ